MIKIGFIGAYEKIDLIMQIARLITTMNKKVLVIDTTITQKAKYIIPVINPTRTYITEFEEIDVAVGFDSFKHMEDYIGTEDKIEKAYDYCLIDVDDGETFSSFEMENASINYFVTSFDVYCIKRGLEILSGMQDTTKLIKIMFSNNMSSEEEMYLDFLSANYNINWSNEKVFFPFDQADKIAIIENQRSSKILYKNLSNAYRESLVYVTAHILGNNCAAELRRNMKNIDKGD